MSFNELVKKYFDADYYLDTYPEVAASDLSPLADYLESGASQGKNPHPFFDTSYYLEVYPDVAATDIPPFEHFLQFGMWEGRIPTASFDPAYYLEANPDVAAAGMNPFFHFFNHGYQEGRSPLPLETPVSVDGEQLANSVQTLLLVGTDGADTLLGGAGDDVLAGLAGNDLLEGGAGTDLFVFEPGFGNDVIKDFSVEDDILMLKAFRIDTLEELEAASEVSLLDGDTLIEFQDGSSVSLVGVSDLSEVEFFPAPLI